jgi:hypothetical protein
MRIFERSNDWQRSGDVPRPVSTVEPYIRQTDPSRGAQLTVVVGLRLSAKQPISPPSHP